MLHTVAIGLAQPGPRALAQGQEELFQPQGGGEAAAFLVPAGRDS